MDKTIYHYHPYTGEYLSIGKADLSPLESLCWLIPAHATDIEPPATHAHEVAIFNDGAWQRYPDWRRVALFSIENGTSVIIKKIGITPGEIGATEQPRPSATHRWNGDHWQHDPNLARQQLTEQRATVLTKLNDDCEAMLAVLRADCPESEVTSWAKQEVEARALVVNPDAPSPLLTAIASTRGLTVTELAQRVITKADTYAISAGTLIGRRQALEDKLMAIDLDVPDAAEQIAAIQWQETT